MFLCFEAALMRMARAPLSTMGIQAKLHVWVVLPTGTEELILNKLEEECEEEGRLGLSQAWAMLRWAWGLNAKRGLVLCARRFTGARGCSVVVKTVVLSELSSLAFSMGSRKEAAVLGSGVWE